MSTRIFRISTGGGEPIYLQLVRQVKQAVTAGVLQPGSRLPSVRALASSLVVNPNTVARAYRMLEDEGVIESSAGRGGSFIAADPNPLGAVERRRRLQPYVDRLVEEARALGMQDDAVEDQVHKALGKSAESFAAR